MISVISNLGFPLITVIFYGILLLEFKSALNKSVLKKSATAIVARISIALAVWVIFITVWSLSGRMQDFSMFPLNMAPVLIIPFVAILLFTFSSTAREILTHLSPQFIVRLQSFRIFVEIIIWLLFLRQMLPIQMTFEGRNFDVLSGITGLLVAWLLTKNVVGRKFLIIWNIACLGLLINIVTIAILSMPASIQYFFNEPYNTAVAKFPYSFLPAFLVPLAYGLHFLSLRQLMLRK